MDYYNGTNWRTPSLFGFFLVAVIHLFFFLFFLFNSQIINILSRHQIGDLIARYLWK